MHNLSEIVIEEDFASAEKVRHAANLGRGREALIVTLVRELGLDEYALAKALAKRTRAAVLDPEAVVIDEHLLRVIPRTLCMRQKFVPLSLEGDDDPTLVIAMADPTDAVAIAEIESETGFHVVGDRVLPLAAIDALLSRYYRDLVTEVMPRTRVRSDLAHDESDLRLEALIAVLERRGLLEDGEIDAEIASIRSKRGRGE